MTEILDNAIDEVQAGHAKNVQVGIFLVYMHSTESWEFDQDML